MCSTAATTDLNVLVLVDQALATLRAAGRAPLAAELTETELTQLVQRLEAAARMAQGHKAAVVQELASRQAHRGHAATSTADLLGQALRLSPGEARGQAELAEGLAVLPDTAAALRDGRIGVGQAQTAVRKANEVKERADGDLLVKEIDATAASAGQVMDRNQLSREIDTRLARTGLDVLAERERSAHRRRNLSWTVRDGMHVLHAELDAVGGSAVRAALDALSDKTGDDDQRSFPQRQADALVQMAAAARADLPQGTLQSARVLLVTTPDALHGAQGAAPAELDGHGPVSTELARQLCCDAQVTVVTTDRNGEILDVGREQRLPSSRQRAAVIARDRRCVGCGAPISHCQIHHVRWWSDDGGTDLDNLVLVCWRCHTRLHQHNWQITRDSAGRYRAGPSADSPIPVDDSSLRPWRRTR